MFTPRDIIINYGIQRYLRKQYIRVYYRDDTPQLIVKCLKSVSLYGCTLIIVFFV